MLTATHFVQLGDNRRPYLARFSVASQCLFRKHQFTVYDDFKLAATRGNQTPGSDIRLKLSFTQNFLRQTDGARGVVSSRAVFNTDLKQRVLHLLFSLLILNKATITNSPV